jgi:hypothetical protein
MHGRQIAGIALVGVGFSLLVINLTGVGAVAVLALGGLAFLFAYLATRSYGLLVPGGILTGLGTALVLDDLGLTEDTALLGLAAGFLLIPLVQLGTAGRRDAGWWWPLIPAGILGTIGTAQLIDGRRTALVLSGLLIVLGLVSLWSGARQAGAARAARDLAAERAAQEHDDAEDDGGSIAREGAVDPSGAAGGATATESLSLSDEPADDEHPEGREAR